MSNAWGFIEDTLGMKLLPDVRELLMSAPAGAFGAWVRRKDPLWRLAADCPRIAREYKKIQQRDEALEWLEEEISDVEDALRASPAINEWFKKMERIKDEGGL